MSETARFTLPLIEAAQAQKHVTHNEALVLLDALAHLNVLDRDLAAPPADPDDGDTYLAAAGASGAWAGHDGEIAWALGGGWRFHAPFEGLLAHVADEGLLIVHTGGAWSEVAPGDVSSVPALGIGAPADESETDTSNRLIVRGSRALFDAAPGSETPGTGDFKVQVSKEAAGNFASFFFADNYEGRAELGLLADDDFSIKVSPDNAAWHEAVRIDKDTGRASFPAGERAGVLELIGETVVAAPAASVDFTQSLIAQCDELYLAVEAMGRSDGGTSEIHFKFSTDGLATFENIGHAWSRGNSGDTRFSTAFSSTMQSAGNTLHTLRVINIAGAYKHLQLNCGSNTTASWQSMTMGTGPFTDAIDAIRVECSTGTITGGTFRLYGRRAG